MSRSGEQIGGKTTQYLLGPSRSDMVSQRDTPGAATVPAWNQE